MTTTDVQQPGYGRPDFRRRPQGQKLELTMEEARAWQECMKSSSAIGPSILTAVIGYTAFRVTRLRPYAKYAALAGGILGLLMGRLSASEICLAKVASMPNSTLRDRLMEARYGNRHMSDTQIFKPPNMVPEDKGSEASTEIVFDDYPPMNSYDTYSSLNDSSDTLASEDTDLSEPINLRKGATYEELRHKNREEYYNKARQYYTPKTQERYPTSETTQQQHHHQQQQQERYSTASTPREEKTKYGDVWG